MRTVNNENAIILSENHNNIIVLKFKVLNDSGKSYVFVYSETTGNICFKPLDPKYYNDITNITHKK